MRQCLRSDHEGVLTEFSLTVNMTAADLRRWIRSEERMAGDSLSRRPAQRLVNLLGKRDGELDEEDYWQMSRVAGRVRARLEAEPPAEETARRLWRRRLMKWGHDPLKGERRLTRR